MIDSAHQMGGLPAMVAEPGSVPDRVPMRAAIKSAHDLVNAPQITPHKASLRAHSDFHNNKGRRL